MKSLALLLILAPPDPVTSIGAVINSDQTLTISWTLPADPSVVGVTIIRDRLDLFEANAVVTLVGAATSYTDTTALVNASYRYWVYTRNAGGELSTGAFVEVIGPNGSGGTVVSSGTSWFCFGAAGGATSILPVAFGAVLLLSLARRR